MNAPLILNTSARPRNCELCPFKTITIRSRGNRASSLAIIGESPGNKEAVKGRPFVGPSGELLDRELRRLGVDLERDCYVDNAIRCLPRGDKAAVLGAAAHACSARLHENLSAVPRITVVALGNAALWSITGNYTLRITATRGRALAIARDDGGYTVVVPAIHPAALFRGTGTLPQFQRDLSLAIEIWRSGGDLQAVRPKGCPSYSVVQTREQLLKAIAYVYSKDIRVLAADIESTGFDPRKERLLSISFSLDANRVIVVPEALVQEARPELKAFFEDRSRRWIWHNGKFDCGFLLGNLAIDAHCDEDTMLLHYSLEEKRGTHDLDQLSGDLLFEPPYKDMAKRFVKKGKGQDYSAIPKDILHEYTARDVANTYRIYDLLRPRVSADKKAELLYTRTLIPASALFQHIERRGILIDKAYLLHMHRVYVDRIKESVQRFKDICVKHLGEDWAGINPGSSVQVAKVLFNELRLHEWEGLEGEPIRKFLALNRGKLSTGKELLVKLPPHPIVQALLDVRKSVKIHSTYIVGVAHAISTDGRVHATYLLHGTVTGRLASRNPNMQNIPRDGDIRAIFRAPPGKVFLEADYSQAELRVLAVLSGDAWLLQVYKEGRKLHDEMSVFLFGKDYTDEDKMHAKMVNFGIAYGREATSLASEFGVPVSEAQKWVDGWFRRAPGAKTFLDRIRAVPERGGTLVSPFGNRRRFPLVSKENLHAAQNEAANFPMQNIASNCMLHAAMETDPVLERMGSLTVNLVHDSDLVECDDDPIKIRDTAELLTKAMEKQPRIWLGNPPINFDVDLKLGGAWGKKHMKGYEL